MEECPLPRLGSPRLTIVGLLLAVAPLSAQYTILVDQGALGVTNVPNGGTVNMVAEAIGAAQTAQLMLFYRGEFSATVMGIDRTGSNDFSITPPALPAELASTGSISVAIRFTPSSGNRVGGRITFTITEKARDNTQTQVSLAVNLTGTAPDLVFSYTPPGASAAPLAEGGVITFPPTPLNTTVTATVAIINRGTAPGTVSSVTSTGSAFQLVGLPLPPVAIEPGKDLRFTVSFAPSQRDPQTGTLRVDYCGRTTTFSLRGSGAAPTYVYELLLGSSEIPVLPNQTLTLADAQVGQKSTLPMRVRNTGNAEGTIQTISVLGPGYQLSDLPFLPLTLPPSGAVTFTIVFAPTQPGKAAGRLRVGNDAFELLATGLGPALNYSYIIGGATNAVQPNGSVLFGSLQVGRSSQARFVTVNRGTTAAVISTIFVTGGTAFTLLEVPDVPLTLEPGKWETFLVNFAPTTVGVAQAVLRVGADSFDLLASATPPTPLPAILLEGPRGPIQPLQQPAYTLSLAEAYPLNLAGTLTLTFNPEVFVNDATVQFATGGRTVGFTLPAGTTRAIFPNNEPQIRLQTGSVAATLTVTPAFATETGISLTPASPPSVSLTIAQSPPQLVSVQLGAKAATSFTLLVTGYSTGRTVSQIELQVTPTAGVNLTNPRLTLNVEAAFVSWYQTAQSQQFGSLFTAVVPVSLEGKDVPGLLVDTIQSVSVTLSNSLGTSAARSVELR